MRSIVSLLTEAVICQIRAKIIENRVFRTIGKEIEIEPRREVSDVNPTTITVFRNNFSTRNLLGESQFDENGKQKEKEEIGI